MSNGKIFKSRSDLDMDQIVMSQYLLLPTIEEMKVHTFESLDPGFPGKVRLGDFVVGRGNFGCDSSREQASSMLKALGVKAAIAKSFVRVFYWSVINIGLSVIVCKELPDYVETRDEMELSLSGGVVKTGGVEYTRTKLPEYVQNISNQGGLVVLLNREEQIARGTRRWK